MFGKIHQLQWMQGGRKRRTGSGDALLQSAVNSGPVMQTPVSPSLLRPLPGTLCSLSSRLPLSRRSGGSLTADSRSQIITLPPAPLSAIKYGFIRSVFRRGAPRQKHVLFSLTYSTGDTNQQWHCHLWAMRYDSPVVRMSDCTAQY